MGGIGIHALAHAWLEYRSEGVVDFEIPSPWMGRFFFSTLLATRIVGDFMIWVFRSGSLWAILGSKKHTRYPALP